MEDNQIDDIARKFADMIAADNASPTGNVPTEMARIGGAIREALATMTAEQDKAIVQTQYCDMIACNPRCLRCGDTPACGDGSWGWMDGVHRHRCRDSHPKCGHDRVPCEKHQPGELIAMLYSEVAALRITRHVKNAEIDRLTAERDEQAEAVRVLGMCVEARRREKIAREGFHVHDATKQTHTHHDWVKAIEDRFTADGLVDANPIARAATDAAGIKGVE